MRSRRDAEGGMCFRSWLFRVGMIFSFLPLIGFALACHDRAAACGVGVANSDPPRGFTIGRGIAGSWPDYAEMPPLEGTDRYIVTKPEHLAWVAARTNHATAPDNFAGKTIVLSADIDLGAHYWMPIGQPTTAAPNLAFSGSIEGNDHIISNLTAGDRSGALLALIKTEGNEIRISDVHLRNASVIGANNDMAAAGLALEIDGITFPAAVTISGCSVHGVFSGSRAGGLVESARGAVAFDDCHLLEGSLLSADLAAGGILVSGLAGSHLAAIHNCTVYGAAISADGDAGGIIAENHGFSISECAVSAVVSGGTGYTGGIVAYAQSFTAGEAHFLENCYAEGAVKGCGLGVGGILGGAVCTVASAEVRISGCTNEAEVVNGLDGLTLNRLANLSPPSSSVYGAGAGGIAGLITGTADAGVFRIDASVNMGPVTLTGTPDYTAMGTATCEAAIGGLVGGVFDDPSGGTMFATIAISGSANEGPIRFESGSPIDGTDSTFNVYAGGLAGVFQSNRIFEDDSAALDNVTISRSFNAAGGEVSLNKTGLDSASTAYSYLCGGGLVGSLYKGDLSLSDSYNRAAVIAGHENGASHSTPSLRGSYAGGLLGRAGEIWSSFLRIGDCYSSAPALSAQGDIVSVTGPGGVVGHWVQGFYTWGNQPSGKVEVPGMVVYNKDAATMPVGSTALADLVGFSPLNFSDMLSASHYTDWTAATWSITEGSLPDLKSVETVAVLLAKPGLLFLEGGDGTGTPPASAAGSIDIAIVPHASLRSDGSAFVWTPPAEVDTYLVAFDFPVGGPASLTSKGVPGNLALRAAMGAASRDVKILISGDWTPDSPDPTDPEAGFVVSVDILGAPSVMDAGESREISLQFATKSPDADISPDLQIDWALSPDSGLLTIAPGLGYTATLQAADGVGGVVDFWAVARQTPGGSEPNVISSDVARVTIIDAAPPGEKPLQRFSVLNMPFDLILEPGSTTYLYLDLTDENGDLPSPMPDTSGWLEPVNEYVTVTVLSADCLMIAVRSDYQPTRSSRPGRGSPILTRTMLNIEAEQLYAGQALRRRFESAVYIGRRPQTGVSLDQGPQEVLNGANDRLDDSGVWVGVGNSQPPLSASQGWYVIRSLDNLGIQVVAPNANVLPECFLTGGKEAADFSIDVQHIVPDGMIGLLPMTYRVTIPDGDMASYFDASLVPSILQSPSEHLDAIFAAVVLQKETKQGPRAGWFTRLIDGVLTPEEAYEAGILTVAGGANLNLQLSYYLLDDYRDEAFRYDDYLIVPDGLHDGVMRDPIWMNRWVEGSKNVSQSSGGGGGCNTGLPVLIFLILTGVFLSVRRA